ncbi:MAG: phosphoribosylamine--glycine ligase [Chloroflexi bacterium]|nr:phosphoribosylamine--glycine ligase [Chloroflexota bacterium]
MKVLIVGNGAREHAIAWKLTQSPGVSELLVAPGNAGTAQIARNVPIGATNIGSLLDFAKSESIEFTVVGPEVPLADGIVDRFQDEGLLIFGPSKAAARIESSKAFAKRLMTAHNIPTAKAETFSSMKDAQAHIEQCELPIVVKADGLAAGKGVLIARTREEAADALRRCMEQRAFGSAGDQVLVEEYLQGHEISVFAFVDGDYVSSIVAACDYKRVGDGDVGPNTGGMGSYSPPASSVWNRDLEAQVRRDILEPVVKALIAEDAYYRGVLYLGLMLTGTGPRVVEFNCRMGDPEAQVTLPRLKSDLLEIMLATAKGKLSGLDIQWEQRAVVGVVVASGGYPGSYPTGYEISGIDDLDDAIVFQAGTRQSDDGLTTLTDGGRVLTVTATGESHQEARRRVYENIDKIRFRDSFYRRDIGAGL